LSLEFDQLPAYVKCFVQDKFFFSSLDINLLLRKGTESLQELL